MRLRFFRLQNYPPLNDISINFSAESPLQRECAIRFVVGVNGSGKTHLLQALTYTFISLANEKTPHFPVSLVYELGQGAECRTLIFDYPGEGANAGWWEWNQKLPTDFQDYQGLIEQVRQGKDGWKGLISDGGWPGKGVGLPRTLLAYTTGAQEPWLQLFQSEPTAEDVDIVSQSFDYDIDVERPAGWSLDKEIEHRKKENTDEARNAAAALLIKKEESSGRITEQDICLFVTPTLLKFALLAVTLNDSMSDLRTHETDTAIEEFIKDIKDKSSLQGLKRLLAEVGWIWPVNVSFTVDFKPDNWPPQLKDRILPFFQRATKVIREPEPSTYRRLFFDLKHKIDKDMPDADVLKYSGDALIDLIGGVSATPFDHFKQLLSLHRQGLIEDIQLAIRVAEPEEVLLFDELSDGEQSYLGRMALFHLMRGHHDALILLDEPKTHFNDKWKREIVDIIDEVLKETANDVLIATHSSITLTDVFNDEIVLFEKYDGEAKRVEINSTTFGADPSEVMARLFDVPDAVGQRAMKWLDKRIADGYWKPEQKQELAELIKKTGPGFYRAELRAILKRLEDASQNKPA